jgi:hypothetical protein
LQVSGAGLGSKPNPQLASSSTPAETQQVDYGTALDSPLPSSVSDVTQPSGSGYSQPWQLIPGSNESGAFVEVYYGEIDYETLDTGMSLGSPDGYIITPCSSDGEQSDIYLKISYDTDSREIVGRELHHTTGEEDVPDNTDTEKYFIIGSVTFHAGEAADYYTIDNQQIDSDIYTDQALYLAYDDPDTGMLNTFFADEGGVQIYNQESSGTDPYIAELNADSFLLGDTTRSGPSGDVGDVGEQIKLIIDQAGKTTASGHAGWSSAGGDGPSFEIVCDDTGSPETTFTIDDGGSHGTEIKTQSFFSGSFNDDGSHDESAANFLVTVDDGGGDVTVSVDDGSGHATEINTSEIYIGSFNDDGTRDESAPWADIDVSDTAGDATLVLDDGNDSTTTLNTSSLDIATGSSNPSANLDASDSDSTLTLDDGSGATSVLNTSSLGITSSSGGNGSLDISDTDASLTLDDGGGNAAILNTTSLFLNYDSGGALSLDVAVDDAILTLNDGAGNTSELNSSSFSITSPGPSANIDVSDTAGDATLYLDDGGGNTAILNTSSLIIDDSTGNTVDLENDSLTISADSPFLLLEDLAASKSVGLDTTGFSLMDDQSNTVTIDMPTDGSETAVSASWQEVQFCLDDGTIKYMKVLGTDPYTY